MEVISSNWTDGDGNHDGGVATGIGFTIAWQRGSLNEEGRNGAFSIEVLEACLHQLNYFQESDLKSEENEIAIVHLKIAIDSLKSRRDRRSKEGTLGTHKKG